MFLEVETTETYQCCLVQFPIFCQFQDNIFDNVDPVSV